MNIKYMHFAVILAETRSFTKAAKKLKVSQPLLSKSIMSLETELNITIFERTSPLNLTQMGEIYITKARSILEMFNDLDMQIKGLSSAAKGRIKIGFSQTSYTLAPKLLPSFCKKFPDADIKAIQTFSALNIRKKLMDDELDIAMLVYPIDTEGLEYHVIKEDKMFLVLPITHELVKKYKINDQEYGKIPIKELKKEKFILPTSHQRNRFEIDKIFKKAGYNPTILFEAESANITASIISSGVGAGFLPSKFITKEFSERVALFEIDEPLLPQTLVLAYKKGKRLPKLGKEFLTMALEKNN